MQFYTGSGPSFFAPEHHFIAFPEANASLTDCKYIKVRHSHKRDFDTTVRRKFFPSAKRLHLNDAEAEENDFEEQTRRNVYVENAMLLTVG